MADRQADQPSPSPPPPHIHRAGYKDEFISSAVIYQGGGDWTDIAATPVAAATDSYAIALAALRKPFPDKHLATTSATDETTRLLHTLSFHRSRQSPPFSSAERALQDALLPHLIAATRQNQLASHTHKSKHNQQVALCDAEGALHMAMPAFIETCQIEWPEWRGSVLPEAIQEAIRLKTATYLGEKIVLELHPAESLFLIVPRAKMAADALSTRELEVAQLFASGADYKSIAQQLDVSPSTIKGHLNKIYGKLNINGKARLVAEIGKLRTLPQNNE